MFCSLSPSPASHLLTRNLLNSRTASLSHPININLNSKLGVEVSLAILGAMDQHSPGKLRGMQYHQPQNLMPVVPGPLQPQSRSLYKPETENQWPRWPDGKNFNFTASNVEPYFPANRVPIEVYLILTIALMLASFSLCGLSYYQRNSEHRAAADAKLEQMAVARGMRPSKLVSMTDNPMKRGNNKRAGEKTGPVGPCPSPLALRPRVDENREFRRGVTHYIPLPCRPLLPPPSPLVQSTLPH